METKKNLTLDSAIIWILRYIKMIIVTNKKNTTEKSFKTTRVSVQLN